MTYNIRLGIQQGLPALSQVIQRFAPDVLAIQEVGSHWKMGPPGDTTTTLSTLTGLEHALYVPCIIEQSARYGHALLSRWPISAHTIIPLEQLKDEPRALLQATITPPQRAPITIISTHLSWLESDRPTQGAQLLQLAQTLISQGHKLIIMGDLNEDSPAAAWHQQLLTTLHDADHTLRRLTYPSSAPRLRLDYLLTNIAPWQQPHIIEDAQASDHFPLSALLPLP